MENESYLIKGYKAQVVGLFGYYHYTRGDYVMAIMYSMTCGGFGLAWSIDWLLVPVPFIYRVLRVVYGLLFSAILVLAAVYQLKLQTFTAMSMAFYLTDLTGFFTTASTLAITKHYSNIQIEPPLLFMLSYYVSWKIGDYPISSLLGYIFPNKRAWAIVNSICMVSWIYILHYLYFDVGVAKMNVIYHTAMRLDMKSIVGIIQ